MVQEGFLEAVASKVRPEGCTVIGQIPLKEELVLTPEGNRTGERLPAAQRARAYLGTTEAGTGGQWGGAWQCPETNGQLLEGVKAKVRFACVKARSGSRVYRGRLWEGPGAGRPIRRPVMVNLPGTHLPGL